MKTKYLIIVGLILAVLTIGAVSASEDMDNTTASDSDAVSVDEGDVIANSEEDTLSGHDPDSVDVSLNDYDEDTDEGAINIDDYNSVLAEIEAPSNATGTVTVKCDNQTVYESDLSWMSYDYDEDTQMYTYEIKLCSLNQQFSPGTYQFNVSYVGDGYYEPASDEGTVKFVKEFSYNFYCPKNVLLGGDAHFSLEINSQISNNVAIILDNKTKVYNGTDGSYYGEYKDLSLELGQHYFNIVFYGDENYDAFTSENYYFNVTRVVFDVPEEVTLGGYPHSIEVTVADLSGNLFVSLDNKTFINSTFKKLYEENGDEEGYTAYIDLSNAGLSLGKHNYTLTYTSGKYVKSESGSFTVDFTFRVESETYKDCEYYKLGMDPDFVYRLPADAKGNISVVFKGKEYIFETTPGETYVEFDFWPDFSLGYNEFTFNYTGENYPDRSYEYSMDVSYYFGVPDEFSFNSTSDEEIIELILPKDAKGNLTVCDDKGNVLKSVALIDGKANMTLGDLSFGSHDIVAKYTGDDYQVEESSQNVKILPNIIYPDYTLWKNGTYNMTVESPENVAGNLSVELLFNEHYDENWEYVYDTILIYNSSAKGRVVIPIPMDKLNVTDDSNYIQVCYIENGEIIVQDIYGFSVMKEDPQWDAEIIFDKEVNKYSFDDCGVIKNIPHVDAVYYVYVDGVEVYDGEVQFYYETDYKDGIRLKIYLNDNVTLGTHTWKVVYTPSYYYNEVVREGTFDLTWITVPEEVIVESSVDFEMVDATGTLSMKIDGKDYAMEFVEDGAATIDLANLALGEHTYEITYSGDATHEKLTKTGKFNVTGAMYFDNIEEGDVMPLSDSYEIVVSLASDATGNVTVSVGGKNQTASIIDGKASFLFSDLSENNYTVIAKYGGDDKYPAKEISCNITIEGYEIIENDGTYSLTLPADATGNLTAYLGKFDENIWDYVFTLLKTVELKDGKAAISVSDLKLPYGHYNIKIAYEGNYTEIDDITELITLAPDVRVSESVSIGQNATVQIDLGNATGSVIIHMNDEEFAVELKDGKINYNITADKLGKENILYFSYSGDDLEEHVFDIYNVDEDGHVHYTHNEYDIAVVIDNLTIPETFNADGSGNITLSLPEDFKGNVSVIVNGEKVSTTPVTGGNVSIPVSGLDTGNNKVTVEVIDDNGKSYSASSDVTVPKPDAEVNITTPTSSKTPEFTVNLPSDATGSLIVNIGDKNYAADLVNGSAIIAPTDLPDGDYNATVKYTGDAKYAGFTKTMPVTINTTSENKTVDPKITAANLKVIYSAGAKYTVTVYGTDGKVAANTTVTFLIDGKTFKTVKTDEKGIASVKITQKPGTYKITTQALGKSVVKTLKVKHILKLKKVKVKRSAKKLVIKASLKKVNGKYLKGEKITLKFKGKKYTAKTNKKGVAKFTIKKNVLKKLKKGKKITYKATYLKDSIKYKVKVKK